MPANVKLAINSSHSMENLEKEIGRFEETIELTLNQIGLDITLNGDIIKPVKGTHFRSQAGVSVIGYPNSDKSLDLIVQPTGLENKYCILCHLTVYNSTYSALDVFEKIMALNQPKRYEVYCERKSVQDAMPEGEAIVCEEDSDWIIDSIPFAPHPSQLIDDQESLKLLFSEMYQISQLGKNHIEEDKIIEFILSMCNFNPDHFGDEITTEVWQFISEKILPLFIEHSYLAQATSSNSGYMLLSKASSLILDDIPFIQDPMLTKARQAKIDRQNELSVITSRMHRSELRMKEIKNKINLLQKEYDDLASQHQLDSTDCKNLKEKLEHLNRAVNFMEKASTELELALS